MSLIAPPYMENPEWKPIRKFYIKMKIPQRDLIQTIFILSIYEGAHASDINPHFTQYIAGEEEYVTNYIYLENFDQEMKELEKRFELKPHQ